MKTILVFACVLLFGCGQDPQRLPDVTNGKGEGRFTLRLVDAFSDDDSYTGRRGVYILTDKETGIEYVGISGIGISEIGSHAAGKGTRHADER